MGKRMAGAIKATESYQSAGEGLSRINEDTSYTR